MITTIKTYLRSGNFNDTLDRIVNKFSPSKSQTKAKERNIGNLPGSFMRLSQFDME